MRLILFVACALALLGQNAETFKARLSAAPADARTRAGLTGTGIVVGTLTGTKLTINGNLQDLRSSPTTASLHDGVAAGVRGPEIGNLRISTAASGAISQTTISGTFDLTPQQIASLHRGGLYIEIHSEKAPDGALWGWLLK